MLAEDLGYNIERSLCPPVGVVFLWLSLKGWEVASGG